MKKLVAALSILVIGVLVFSSLPGRIDFLKALDGVHDAWKTVYPETRDGEGNCATEYFVNIWNNQGTVDFIQLTLGYTKSFTSTKSNVLLSKVFFEPCPPPPAPAASTDQDSSTDKGTSGNAKVDLRSLPLIPVFGTIFLLAMLFTFGRKLIPGL